MLRANHAVRLGLRASSRNPELGFGRALIDQLGNLIAFLPVLLFALLVTAAAGTVGYGLSLLFAMACTAGLIAGLPLAVEHPRPPLFAGAALIGTASIAGSFLLDMLGRLILIRAAAFGEGVSVAFGKAISLLSARLGACFVITLAFMLLDLIVAATVGTLTSMLSAQAFFDPDLE